MAVFVSRNWKDLPDLSTSIDSANLNRLEAGIVAAYIQGTGTLVNADLAAGAAVGIAKLAGYPTDATKFLRGDGTWAAPAASGMTQIADSTLGVAAALFDFTGLPTTYAHLRLVAMLRGDQVTTTAPVTLRVNNDSGANYDYEVCNMQAAVAPADSQGVGQTSFSSLYMPGSTATASYPGFLIVDFAAYAGTTFFKTIKASNGYLGSTATTTVQEMSGWWRNTAAINRITLGCGSNFVAGSRASIYAMGS